MNKLSIIIPVRNEEINIKPLIHRVDSALKKANIVYEAIFIDDHSADKTLTTIKKMSKNYPVHVFSKKGQVGKAYSLIEGFGYAHYDIVAILDGDLQYPPEALPEMVRKITEGADVVVANRRKAYTSQARRLSSKLFRSFFGKFLFGLDHDIQAGMKVMRREVIDSLPITPRSGWAYDLELLYRSRRGGFIIENVDIEFAKRQGGKSKLSIIKAAKELMLDALQVKMAYIPPVQVIPHTDTMLGARVYHNGHKYVTHTTLHPRHSAIETFMPRQKVYIGGFLFVVAIGLILRPIFILQILIGALSFIYFVDVLFNLYLVLKSLKDPQEISFTTDELESLQNKELPIYSILCPLYKEAQIIPQFLTSIDQLDYPKNKLDVMLLLEEDDTESIQATQAMAIPSYVRIVVVPHSYPRTKPKACNYGLSVAKGEYLVIYDAEDSPDRLQLKKAYLGFQKSDDTIFCLQAKLNYYNPTQNLLTRFFTAEYSLWFDITLTGLQSLNTSLPLGGTSNHFKTANLKKLEGWDPFNVTEDADLGIRLFRQGYKTAIIDSVTLEEANSKWGNWLRQRSRWIKGYMQTYLVHTRSNRKLFQEKGWHALAFYLIVGGKIAFILINPLLWLTTIAYFVLYAYVGQAITALYPTVIFYTAATSLVFGNFLFLYYYMIGCAKREQWYLIKYIFLVPVYWLMMSIAASIALYQLILKPHYWEKTVHGLHLRHRKSKVSLVKVKAAEALNIRYALAKLIPSTYHANTSSK